MPIYNILDYADFVEPREKTGPSPQMWNNSPEKEDIDDNAPIIINDIDFTDPDVFFDPDFPRPILVETVDEGSEGNPTKGEYIKETKSKAKNIPVIRVNNTPLNKTQLDYVKIFSRGFLPTIHVVVKDPEKVLQLCDSPGLNNSIAISFMPEVNGTYKKINLSFYITNVDIFDDYVAYDGEFKYQKMSTEVFDYVNLLPQKPELTTWETLYVIANKMKLGYATTHECKNIVDKRYRIVQSKTYTDYIIEQVSMGGLDDNSIFDSWIDLFGYLVLINVAWVMKNEQFNPQNITVLAHRGIHSEVEHGPEVEAEMFPRIITNYRSNENSTNMLFDETETEMLVNNSAVYYEGALNTNYYMMGPCDTNVIQIQQLQVIEDSHNGMAKSDEYENSKINFIGIEFEDLPITIKKMENKKYFDKLRSRIFKVKMTLPNFGLERGKLVNVVLQQYNNQARTLVSGNRDIEKSGQGATDIFMSGTYYIDGVEFEYKFEDMKITQYLYLIKRGMTTTASDLDVGRDIIFDNDIDNSPYNISDP